MLPLEFRGARLGNLGVIECVYEIGEDIEPMNSFNRIYLHNTFKHTNTADLLDYHVNGRRFAGIEYHFAIDERGNVYSTRPLNVMGAHTYGRNRESIGVVLLDCNKCAESRIARRNFAELHGELSEIAGIDLPVLSHTYGQFEHLDEMIRKYNEGLAEEMQFPHVEFDESVADNHILTAKRYELIEILDAYRRRNQHSQKNISEEKQEDFSKLVTAIDLLKICPGRSYFAFVREIQKR